MLNVLPCGPEPFEKLFEALFGSSKDDGRDFVLPEVFGLYVRVAEQEGIERALKRFKKQVQKAGILSDYRRKKFFESPAQRRKRKSAAARRRQLKRTWHGTEE